MVDGFVKFSTRQLTEWSDIILESPSENQTSRGNVSNSIISDRHLGAKVT